MSAPTYTFHVLVAQRLCRYDGEYLPEALAVADQITMDENPSYMATEVKDAQNSLDFAALRVLKVQIPLAAVDQALELTVDVKGEVAS